MAIILQGFIAVIIIGVVYSLWQTTKSYGGLIGSALKWIGLGIVFFTVESFDRVFATFGNLSILNVLGFADPDLVHNFLLVLGLLFSGVGFSKLTRIAKK